MSEDKVLQKWLVRFGFKKTRNERSPDLVKSFSVSELEKVKNTRPSTINPLRESVTRDEADYLRLDATTAQRGRSVGPPGGERTSRCRSGGGSGQVQGRTRTWKKVKRGRDTGWT